MWCHWVIPSGWLWLRVDLENIMSTSWGMCAPQKWMARAQNSHPGWPTLTYPPQKLWVSSPPTRRPWEWKTHPHSNLTKQCEFLFVQVTGMLWSYLMQATPDRMTNAPIEQDLCTTCLFWFKFVPSTLDDLDDLWSFNFIFIFIF